MAFPKFIDMIDKQTWGQRVIVNFIHGPTFLNGGWGGGESFNSNYENRSINWLELDNLDLVLPFSIQL